MWSDPVSGFEANQYSPAGTAERQWLLIQRLGRTRRGRRVVTAVVVLLGLIVVASVVQSVVR